MCKRNAHSSSNNNEYDAYSGDSVVFDADERAVCPIVLSPPWLRGLEPEDIYAKTAEREQRQSQSTPHGDDTT
jgi:hypothetical protein